jgi:hypothetical protein
MVRRLVGSLILVAALVCSAPSPLLRPAIAQSQGNPSVRVWVNTKSGVYHCPGSQWYGTTKKGSFMSQGEALKNGFRPAYGRYCQ